MRRFILVVRVGRVRSAVRRAAEEWSSLYNGVQNPAYRPPDHLNWHLIPATAKRSIGLYFSLLSGAKAFEREKPRGAMRPAPARLPI